MASATVTKKLREEATCPICLELMTEPVSIDCGHNYCHLCIVELIGSQTSHTSSLRTFHCPQCRKPFKSDSIRPNKQLGNIIETIKETDHESLCKEHGEQLNLYCKDDGQLICWRCERSPQHKGHVTALVEDACQGYKKQLQKAVTKLEDTRSRYMLLKLDRTQKINNWEVKIKHEKERIHSEFKSLHNFLNQEEEFYMCRLEKEQEQKLSRLQNNVAHLENKLQELKNGILELDKKCQGSAQHLLQDIKNTLSRVSDTNLETPEDVSLELHTVCNVSELNFTLKKMLKHFQDNMTLNPDTTYQKLHQFDNQNKVDYCGFFLKSQTSGGFRVLPCILGCERFTSGRHYFEVDVREGTEWGVGVCLENVPRDIDTGREPQSGFWAIRLRKNKDNLALTSPPTALPLRDQPEVVGIILDCEAGLISFYNATTGSHIYTFPKASFSHALRPYFEAYPFFSLSQTSSNRNSLMEVGASMNPMDFCISAKAMASATVTKKLLEEVKCPICLDMMTEAVTISCGHNYCRMCIVSFTENQTSETSSSRTFHCPQCRKPFKSDSIQPNKQLGNIIETIKETDYESLCEKHGEQFHLFCEDDGQLICWCCERSPQHKGHVTALVEVACQSYKEKLQEAVAKLKITESKYKQLKKDTTQKISSWEEKIKHEEDRIRYEFSILHTFLHEEEELYMCQLKKEKEQKLSSLQENVAHLDNKLQELRNCILELDKKCQDSAQKLLQDIKDTLSRNSTINMETPKDVSLELNTVCNVSDYFNMRKILKCYQVNVTLDPDTAHPGLDLSENQRRMCNVEKLDFGSFMTSQFAKEFIVAPWILGQERFTSGRHYFEVDVLKGNECGLGGTFTVFTDRSSNGQAAYVINGNPQHKKSTYTSA
ncbi:E3 ubiquitin-protein ligase TRIM38-like [Sorex fumeus]|uniref:E3 ubiquitin-protein ligase TRIM38-like n=1 Tax=Sorex fumeus TaxID=62283 RepID=UPI0024AD5CD0|nr:E3 ubiquitin-protein ligase TRIM38-like [Sorex fumeus]